MGSWRTTWIAGLALTLALSGCGSTSDDGSNPDSSPGDEPPPTSAPPTTPSETTPTPLETATTDDSQCPAGWKGLTVGTQDPSEVAYLEKMPACTNEAEDTVLLGNRTDVVWKITTTVPAPYKRTHEPPSAQSYREIVSGVAQGQVLLAPRDDISVNAPPADVSFTVDWPLSLSWDTHEIAREELTSWGLGKAALAVGGSNSYRTALAQCTLSGFEVGGSAAGMKIPDSAEDTQELLTDVVGIGVDGNRCWQAARTIKAPAASPVASDDLAKGISLKFQQNTVLERIHTTSTWTQRATGFLYKLLQLR